VAALLGLEADGRLSKNQVKDVLAVLVREGGDPGEIADRLGLVQVHDEAPIAEAVRRVLDGHPAAVENFRTGKEKKAVGFLMGRVMREMGGKANPKTARRILEEELRKRTGGRP
jgi:aspartyl-tRNA(Asn)/glutamyl-tRNA(Gln) amidotransferase subunit B